MTYRYARYSRKSIHIKICLCVNAFFSVCPIEKKARDLRAFLVRLCCRRNQMNKVVPDSSASARKAATPPTSTPSINSSRRMPITSIDI